MFGTGILEGNDRNLGFRGSALHSCSESLAVEPGKAKWEIPAQEKFSQNRLFRVKGYEFNLRHTSYRGID